jgi:hypothetical protein
MMNLCGFVSYGQGHRKFGWSAWLNVFLCYYLRDEANRLACCSATKM